MTTLMDGQMDMWTDAAKYIISLLSRSKEGRLFFQFAILNVLNVDLLCNYEIKWELLTKKTPLEAAFVQA